MSVDCEKLIAQTRNVAGLLSFVMSHQVRAALRCEAQPPLRDALFECAQSLAHYSLRLRILAGTRALSYHLSPYHTTLVLLIRLVSAAVCAGLELFGSAANGVQIHSQRSDQDDTQSLPYIVQYAVQHCGAELGRELRVADQLRIVHQDSIVRVAKVVFWQWFV